ASRVVFSPNGQVGERRSSRASAQGSQRGQENVSDCGPAVMPAGDTAIPWSLPNGVLMKTRLGGDEISSGQGCIEASYRGNITLRRHHTLPQRSATIISTRICPL